MSDKPRRGPGRPSSYTEAKAAELCFRLAQGRSLRSVCKDDDMPGMKTVFQWLGKNDQFAQQYAHAKQEASDALFEELLDIADNEEGDTQRDRLRVDTRKWMMSKMKPKKYGDRQFVENTHKIDPVERLEAAMERAQRQRAEIEKKIH